MITFTEEARQEIERLMEQQDRDDLVLRIALVGRGPQGFQYDMAFVAEEDRREEDMEVDAGSFKAVLDERSAGNMEGTTVDFVNDLQRRGFQIDNPNAGWADPLADAVQEVIDTRINPGVGMHGGFVSLTGVREGVAYIRFGGGCQGCGMVDTTLREGVAAQIREEVPEIEDVVDTTDHAAGTDPYYASKSAD
ncbi:MAG: iron-sulfur cluster assembly accessory protein [bacterium]